MSFVKDTVKGVTNAVGGVVDTITGAAAADASQDAASAQVDAANSNIAFQQSALDTIRGDLEPYRTSGASALSDVSSLISDPNKQLDYIQDNPFFKFLADDAQRRLFNNKAARGKVGTGGTALALQNSQMLLGDQLVGNQINRQMGIANLGQNAAAQTGAQTANTANAIGSSILGAGNAQAAGYIGEQNAYSDALSTGINTALGAGSIMALTGAPSFDFLGPSYSSFETYT